MTSDQIVQKIKEWVYKIAPRNVSNQDQILDHFFPHLAVTLLLLTLPYGLFVALLVLLFAGYKEFVEDKHYKDFFSKTIEGADGRCDLFFRLGGSAIAYLTLVWR